MSQDFPVPNPPATPSQPLHVAVLGATGLVGRKILEQLEQRSFPVASLRPLASARPGRRTVSFRGQEVEVEAAGPDSFEGVDLVLASAGSGASRELLPAAAAAGAFCVDNSSAYRMDPEVPLVVPEVNADHMLESDSRIVANPNCSTIQLVVALAPIQRAAGLRRVAVSTYQSASGAGAAALDELRDGAAAVLEGANPEGKCFPRRLAFNALPQIGEFDEAGHSQEERKMMREVPKILGSEVPVDACCVRVPTFVGHCESVIVETERPLTPEDARALLARSPGVELAAENDYATPAETAGRPEVFVSRVRRSAASSHGLQFWVVADNLLKGAALNAVQVAECYFAAREAGRKPSASIGSPSSAPC